MTDKKLADLDHIGDRELLLLILERVEAISDTLDRMMRVEQARQQWEDRIGHC